MIRFYKRLHYLREVVQSIRTGIHFYRKKGGCLNDKENRNSITFKTIRIHTAL